jgi:hypothetical protein
VGIICSNEIKKEKYKQGFGSLENIFVFELNVSVINVEDGAKLRYHGFEHGPIKLTNAL